MLILVFLWGGFNIVRKERFVVSSWAPDGQGLLLLKTMIFFNNSSSRFYIASDDPPFLMAPFVLSHLTSGYTVGNEYPMATWSPDGCCLAFSDTNDPEVVWPYNIFVYNLSSQITTQITNAGFDTSPTWSPDGSKIAFARDWQNIYIVQINGEGLTQITNFEPDYAGGGPSGLDWSPDGSKIAFDYRFDIFLINPDGSGLTNLTANEDGSSPSWSPDGEMIVFSSDRDGNYQIYIMNSDGSNVVRLTNNNWDNILPLWSPDGKKISFISDQNGIYDIYLLDVDSGQITRMTNLRTRFDLLFR